jgi:hypothetical protein
MHVRLQRTEGTARWVTFSTAALGLRYRALEGAAVQPPVSQVQVTGALRGRFRIDGANRFAIHAGAATGHGFAGGWNTTGIGTGTVSYDLALKEVYLSTRPSPRFDLQVGGLYLLRGQSTEGTSYDNDGFIVGERVVMRSAFGRVFDEVALTRAYLGDFADANVFHRLHRLHDRAHYHQVLAQKRAGSATVSADYTADASSHIVRTAVTLALPRPQILIDHVRVESYARVNPAPGYGYAITVRHEGRVGAVAAMGVSQIDNNYTQLNGDLYGRGRRVYASFAKRTGTGWLWSAQVARAIGSAAASTPRTRLETSLACDLLRALRHSR